MRTLCILTMFTAAYLSSEAQLIPAAVQLTNTEMHKFASNSVGDTFRIEVALPGTYTSTSESFPVLYLLDSDKSFGMARDIVNWLVWSAEMPPVIIVGISYGGTTETWWDKRSRDYTPTKDYSGVYGTWPHAGGGPAFKSFLKDELFPFVNQTYRTIPDDRAIVGLSFGGLFAAYILFTESSTFNRYIIIAPALEWDYRRVFVYETEFSQNHTTLSAQVFTAVGQKDVQSILQPWQDFNAVVASRKYDSLNWVQHTFSDETHISVFPGAFSHGLKSVYSNEPSTDVTRSARLSQLPKAPSLLQNFPNPFNPTTAMSYQLAAVSNVTLKVYDLLGREVAVLVNQRQNPGNHTLVFDAASLPSGVYFYRLKAGSFTDTKKLLLLR